MARKQRQRVDLEIQGRRERRSKAPLIREKWPHVAKLTLEFKYEDRLWPSYGPDAKTIEQAPDDQAFFDYSCPHECFEGGFELTGAVSRVAESGESGCSGELVCAGWVTSSGGEDKCGLTLKYKVKVEYKTDA